jgi:hypothetical protein
VGGRIASFSPPAYLMWAFLSAKCVTISLLLITRHEHYVTHRNIIGPDEQQEKLYEELGYEGLRLNSKLWCPV